MNFKLISNPIIDMEPVYSPRDPAVIFENERYYCFHTAVHNDTSGCRLTLNVAESTDLIHWQGFRCLNDSPLGFSSPGNILHVDNKWIMCVQTYPIPEGELYGSGDARLWLMESDNLTDWREPRIMVAAGCQANWSGSPRQIDPYLVYANSQYWCFYKANGCLGLLVSKDLQNWQEASPDRPVLGPAMTPDGATVENPCVITDKGQHLLFFSPCREGRGIGIARSDNLLDWHDVRYLDFPDLGWAVGGPTAAMVVDRRQDLGCWLMFFHGERSHHFGAAIGVAWSADLIDWHVAPDLMK